MKRKSVMSTVRTALDSHIKVTARELAGALDLKTGSVRRALRQLRREKSAVVAYRDTRRGNYWIAAQFHLPI